MERSVELRIKGHLYEIREANDAIVESRQGLHVSLNAYKKTLESVAKSGDVELVDDVAGDIKDRLKETGDRPSNQEMRKEARTLLAEQDIVPDDYLLNA
jgi:gas vesicle protein